MDVAEHELAFQRAIVDQAPKHVVDLINMEDMRGFEIGAYFDVPRSP